MIKMPKVLSLIKKENRKNFLLLFGMVLLIIFLNINSISAVSCWVEGGSSPEIAASNCNNAEIEGISGSVIMYLSDTTNAHGATEDNAVYNNVLCCNLGTTGSSSCTGNNKILGLFSSINAHGERPENTGYTPNICYSYLVNSFAASSTQPGPNEVEVISLSSETNAHLGDYDLKIIAEVSGIAAQCELTSAEWEYDEVMEGTDVGAIVNGTGCEEEAISFEVFRGTTSCYDIGTECTNPPNVIFATGRNSVTGTWNAGPSHDDEYHFVATVDGLSETVKSDNLLVTENICDEITICAHYTTKGESYCNPDPCGVAGANVPIEIDCDERNCFCAWNSTTNECQDGWEISGYCGNDVINTGETCDNDNWGPIITGCDNFDVFTGGPLDCYAPETSNECRFDTSLCTGGTIGICNDGTVNIGETCDTDDWGPIITGCSDFGFAAGTLICGSNCFFDTSLCTGGIDSEIGTCIYTQFTDDNCDDGFLTFNWTGEWTWDDECVGSCQIENQYLADECGDGQKTRECPAQIPLPFFNIYSFIATLTIIALVYVILILRKEKRKR